MNDTADEKDASSAAAPAARAGAPAEGAGVAESVAEVPAVTATPADASASAPAASTTASAPIAAAPPSDVIGPDEVLSLPPPPSHPDMDDDAEPPRSRSASTSASASSTATKASSAAFSLAAAAKSRLAQGGRMMLSPLVHTGSNSGANRTASSDKLASAVSQSSAASSTTTATTTASSAASPPSANNSSSSSSSVPLSVASISHGIASLPGAAASLGSLLFSSPGSSSAATSTTPGNNNSSATNNSGGGLDADRPDASDAAALAAATEELRQVSVQQRMQLLEDLVQSRRADWSYLKAMHAGNNYWLNVALLREQQVLAHLGEKQTIRRSVQFFYLGLGLGRLISECTHAPFLAMDGCQLLEELEFYFSSAAVQGMKLMVATSSSLHEPVDALSGDDDGHARYSLHEPFRPTLFKWNQRPVFRRLATPPIPFSLDYREVLLSLCDILAIIYSKFVEDPSSSEHVHVFQAILRFDERIKKLVIEPVKKEFSAVALHVLAEEIASVRKLHSAGSDAASPAPSIAPAVSVSPPVSSSPASAPAATTTTRLP